ncbi:MAG: DUF3316 domain-containing protein [Muribaculaceae bacterium]|nr:DUF3316 domain-containing protein [Muribaculaceae bacterium]
MFHRLQAIILALPAVLGLTAAEPLPVTSAYSLEFGTAHRTDTYLSPLHYDGTAIALDYERIQPMRFSPERWEMMLHGTFGYSRMLNPAGTARMQQLELRPSWSMMRVFRPAEGLRVAIGGNATVNAGVLYLPRNGNNPAQAQVSATLGLTAAASYDFSIGRLPVTVRYMPRMPLIGAFFGPDYDELYYEIWLGNHSGLCHFAWPGSYFRLDNLLTADLHFGRTTLRLGYRMEYFDSYASGNTSRSITHSFVVGVVIKRISLPIR